MFDIEQSIADWRRRMLAAGVKTPVPLEELEGHLREEIERAAKSGLDAPQALQAALQQIGRPDALKNEFRKNERSNMKRTMLISAALFGSVLGGAMVLPALGVWQRTGVLRAAPLAFGLALAISAGGAALYGIKTQRGAAGRKWIGLCTMAAGFFYVVPLLQAFFIPTADGTSWAFCLLLAAASILFYGGCLRLLLRRPAPPAGQS